MRKWEDIVKDKLERYESALPEGSLEEFRARRGGGAAPEGAGAARRGAAAKPAAPWRWGLPAALAAAALAAVLLLRAPGTPDAGVRVVPQAAAPVAEAAPAAPAPPVADPAAGGPAEPAPQAAATTPRLATLQPSPASRTAPPGIAPQNGAAPETQTALPVSDATDTANAADTGATAAPGAANAASADVAGTGVSVHVAGADETVGGADTAEPAADEPAPSVMQSSPYVPATAGRKPVPVKVVPVAGAVAGGGLLTALASALVGSKSFADMEPSGQEDYMGAEPPKDLLTGRPVHHIPLKAGLSLRIPVAERLSVTTGLAYSAYASTFTYSLSGEKKQWAHYLGVPLRLDWTLASSPRWELYVGGGLEGDYCVAATRNGESIVKDGFGLSALGAGGVQMNLSKHLGLYLEPALSWTFPSQRAVLETRRSAHPLQFTVTTGLRFTL